MPNRPVSSPPLGIVPVGRVIVVSDLILVHAVEHERRQRREDPCSTPAPDESHPSTPISNISQTKREGPASSRPNLRAPALTWKVVEEGDRDGAADDGVHPEPPSSPEDGPGHAWPDDPPQQRKVLHGRDLSSPNHQLLPPSNLLACSFPRFSAELFFPSGAWSVQRQLAVLSAEGWARRFVVWAEIGSPGPDRIGSVASTKPH